METIKSFARRTTQTLREKVGNASTTAQDDALRDACKVVLKYKETGELICTKILRLAELMEELGKITKDIGDAYMKLPELQPESGQLAADIFDVGSKLVLTAQEHQKGLKEQCFDVLTSFLKEASMMKTVEERRRNNRLEYDFFRQKVLGLRQNPPKDITRIMRNEERMENWRVKLWEATEHNKAVCSKVYSEGQRAIDLSVLTFTQVLGSYLNIAGNGFKQQFVNARLPVYSTAPILPPAPLPPSPHQRYQPPFPPALPPGVYPLVPHGQQPAYVWQQNVCQWGQPPVWQQPQLEQQQQTPPPPLLQQQQQQTPQTPPLLQQPPPQQHLLTQGQNSNVAAEVRSPEPNSSF